MKDIEEMNFKEKVDWATGKLIISIGNGNFKDELTTILLAVISEAYHRGYNKRELEEKNV